MSGEWYNKYIVIQPNAGGPRMKSWEDLQPRRKRGITEQVSAEIH